MDRPHRPVRLPIEAFDVVKGGDDPAVLNRVAYETARALLHRVQGSDDAEVIERTVRYTAEHGIDDVAELWSRAAARSLPGALWRLYLIHAVVAKQPAATAETYRCGAAVDPTMHHIVAGAVEPTGPREMRELTETILRGAFTGDFADALARAASFCAVMSIGSNSQADDLDARALDGADEVTARSVRYLELSRDLAASAALARDHRLD